MASLAEKVMVMSDIYFGLMRQIIERNVRTYVAAIDVVAIDVAASVLSANMMIIAVVSSTNKELVLLHLEMIYEW